MVCFLLMVQPAVLGAQDRARERTGVVAPRPTGLPLYGQAGCGFLEDRGQLADGSVLLYSTGPVALEVLWDSVRVTLGHGPGACSYTMRFEGQRPEGFTGPEGERPMSHPTNFLLGSDPSKWVRGVRTFEHVLYGSLYDGIDLALRDTPEGPKYTFMVAPGGRVGDIRVSVEGADGLGFERGELVVTTAAGEVRDAGLVAYQDGPSGSAVVPCSFVMLGPTTYGFELGGAMDPLLPLRIDPVIFSTFLGGDDVDWLHAIDMGGNGTVYVAGYTDSRNFPTTDGAAQSRVSGGFDVYVACISPDGSRLEWATLAGGSAEDMPWGIAVDGQGRVYVTGHTESADFPTTWGAYNSDLLGTRDAFAIRLAPDGSRLEWSTLLGAEGVDQGMAIRPMADGSAFVAGQTTSHFFPVTVGSYDMRMDGGSDVFVTHISPDGMSLEASTLLGGTGDESEPAMTLDGQGHLCVAGSTTSPDFPTMSGAYDRSYSGAKDAFLAVLDPDLRHLGNSTLLGGLGSDVPRSLEWVSGGRLLVSGYTTSPDLPTTTPDFGRYFGGRTDGFVAMLDGGLHDLQVCAYLGGSDYDVAQSAWLGPSGTLVVAGYTNSTDLPTTPDAYKRAKAGSDHDMLYMEIDPVEGSLNYSTYIGGSSGDDAMGMELDQWGVPVIAGFTNSPDFPMLGEGFDRTFGGGGDSVVLRFVRSAEPPELRGDLTTTEPTTGDPMTFEVLAWDPIAVATVGVEYGFDGGDVVTVPMAVTPEGTYRLNVTVPPSARALSYTFDATNVLGLSARTALLERAVADNDPPRVLADLTPGDATAGAMLEFAVRAEDNIGVDGVVVEYRSGTGPVQRLALTLAPTDPGLYTVRVQLSNGSLEPMTYRFVVKDGALNANVTAWRTVPIFDRDPPSLGVPLAPSWAGPGTEVMVNVTATDNVGVVRARLQYTFDGRNIVEVPAEPPLGPDLSFTITVPSLESRDVIYTIIAEDAAGNVANRSGIIVNRDLTPPTIVPLDVCGTAYTGNPFPVRFSAHDASGIALLYVRWWFGTGQSQLYSYPTGGELYWSIDVPSDSVEPLFYVMGAEDLRGQRGETQPTRVPVLDDDLPVAEAGEAQTIESGQSLRVDAGASHDNIGIVKYVWLYEDVGVLGEGQGRILNVTLASAGPHQVRLVVYDAAGNSGSDTVTVQVTAKENGGGPPWWAVVGVLTAVLVAGSAVGLLLTRRRGRPGKGS